MRIRFELKAKILVPDADIFPPVREVERKLTEFLAEEGMVAYQLDVTNYVDIDKETEDPSKWHLTDTAK